MDEKTLNSDYFSLLKEKTKEKSHLAEYLSISREKNILVNDEFIETHKQIDHLPPVEMFPKKIIDNSKVLYGNDTNQLTPQSAKPVVSSDSEKKVTRITSAEGGARTFVQARSVVKTSVPVYPDVQKPLKSSLQEVLDVKVMQGHMGVVLCLYFDNIRLYSGGADNAIRLWHPKLGRCLLKFLGHKGGVHCLDYCEESAFLYSGSWDTTIRMWDVGNFKAGGILSGHTGAVIGVTVLSRSRLISCSSDGTLRLWNTTGCACLLEQVLIPPPTNELSPLLRMSVWNVSQSGSLSLRRPIENMLSASLCMDGTVHLSYISSKMKQISRKWNPALVFGNSPASYQGLSISIHGNLIAVATVGKSSASTSKVNRMPIIWLCDIKEVNNSCKSNKEMAEPKLIAAIEARNVPTSLYITFGKLFAGFMDGIVQIWDLNDLVVLLELTPHTTRVRDIRATSDSVTTCDDDGHVVVTKLSPALALKK